MVATDTKLIIGGAALLGLGYFLFKDNIGKAIDGAANIPTGIGNAVLGTGNAVADIADTTATVVRDATSPLTIIKEESDTAVLAFKYFQDQIQYERDRALRAETERLKYQEQVGANQGKGDVAKSSGTLDRTTITEKEKTLRTADTQKALTTANKTVIETVKNFACNVPFVKDTSLCKTQSTDKSLKKLSTGTTQLAEKIKPALIMPVKVITDMFTKNRKLKK